MSGHPGHEHQNPDYYPETASLGSAPPPYQEYVDQYPPPPPPPAGDSTGASERPPPEPPRPHTQHEQPFFPPPPGQSAGGQGAHHGQGGGGVSSDNKTTLRERLFQWSTKAGVPVNKLTNKLGSEAWWPSTLDVECDKAARILKSFTKDGFYTTDDNATKTPTPKPAGGPKQTPKVLVKIPQKAIETAAGLAIFTTFRTGLHFSGAGGSGVIVSRLPDGSWSPPSGFLVHTLGAGLMIGLDIYDCVCVLRTPEAVRAFTRPRLSLGGEVGLVAGPVGAGAAVDAALAQDTKPVWGYVKSRGFYAGVQADGTVIIARPDANAAFYGVKGVKVDEILGGKVPDRGPEGMWPTGASRLMEVLKSAQGRRDVDEGVMNEVGQGPTPGDLGMEDGARKQDVKYT